MRAIAAATCHRSRSAGARPARRCLGRRVDCPASPRSRWVVPARYYDPATAQWLTRDPLEALTQAPYDYVDNNPLNNLDPLGLSSCGDFSLGGLADCGSKAGHVAWHGGAGLGRHLCEDWVHGGLFGGPCDDLRGSQGSRSNCTPGAIEANIRGLERELQAHQQKLDDYQNDPLASDNDGRLAQAYAEGNAERAASIIRGRINKLQRQIDNFQRQIDEQQLKEAEAELDGGGEGGE